MFGSDERLIQFWLSLYPMLLFPLAPVKYKASSWYPPGKLEIHNKIDKQRNVFNYWHVCIRKYVS